MQKEFRAIVRRAVEWLPSDGTYLGAMRGLSRLAGGGQMTMEQRGGSVLIDGRHCIPSVKRLPFYVRGLGYRARKLTSDYLLDHISFDPGDLVIDCGANVGDLLLSLEATGVPLRYIAFEPGKVEFDCLSRNARHFPRFAPELHHRALGERNGTATFYANADAADGSVLQSPGATETFDVEIVRLDALQIDRVKLLKLEAEGYEPEILEGARGAFDRIEYIAADVGFERGPNAESTLPAVTNLLLNHGFRVVANARERLVLLFRNMRWAGT